MRQTISLPLCNAQDDRERGDGRRQRLERGPLAACMAVCSTSAISRKPSTATAVVMAMTALPLLTGM